MAFSTFQKPDNSETPCPSCQQGTGYLRGVRAEATLKLLTYVCQTCEHRWQASERWMDDWYAGSSTGPSMTREESKR